MIPNRAPEWTPHVSDRRDPRIPSAATEHGLRHITRPAPVRSATVLVVLLGVGALWAWSRPRSEHKAKRRPDMPTLAGGRGLHVERTVTVQGWPETVYRAWRDLESLPRLLPGHLVSVTPSGGGRTRWNVAGPGSLRAGWGPELTADEPGRLIAWRSAPGSTGDIAGSVRFDAVGTEAHGTTPDACYAGSSRWCASAPTASTRFGRRSRPAGRGGTVSIPGVYGGLLDKVPFGAAFAKGLTCAWGRRTSTGIPARGVPNVERQDRRLHQGRPRSRGVILPAGRRPPEISNH
jgi:hypothetical protein